jgi:hypothetical protein
VSRGSRRRTVRIIFVHVARLHFLRYLQLAWRLLGELTPLEALPTTELNIPVHSKASWPSVIRRHCQLRVECNDATKTTNLQTQCWQWMQQLLRPGWMVIQRMQRVERTQWVKDKTTVLQNYYIFHVYILFGQRGPHFPTNGL